MDVNKQLDAIDKELIYHDTETGFNVSNSTWGHLISVREHIEEQDEVIAKFREACKAAMEYYEMLEKATGIEHGCLKLLRAAIAKAEATDD